MVCFLTFNEEAEQYLVAAVLRRGNATGSLGALGILRRLIGRVSNAFPKARIRVRLDGGFASPEVLDFLDCEPKVEYLVNLASNDPVTFLLHLVKCLKILENLKSNLSLRAAMFFCSGLSRMRVNVVVSLFSSRFHSWRVWVRESRQLQRAFVAKLSSAWMTATPDIHHGVPDLRSFHGRDRNLPRRSGHHLRGWDGFTLNQAPHHGDTYSQPAGGLLERETVRRDTTRIVGGQLTVVPYPAHPHFAPAVARTGSYP
jgi:hypothetical protein